MVRWECLKIPPLLLCGHRNGHCDLADGPDEVHRRLIAREELKNYQYKDGKRGAPRFFNNSERNGRGVDESYRSTGG